MIRRHGSGLLLVMIDIDPDHEEEFNRWYNEEHFPERVHCPGFLESRRYTAVEGGPKYLATYELESPEVLESDEYRKIAGPSPWTSKMRAHFQTSLRTVYRDITPEV